MSSSYCCAETAVAFAGLRAHRCRSGDRWVCIEDDKGGDDEAGKIVDENDNRDRGNDADIHEGNGDDRPAANFMGAVQIGGR